MILKKISILKEEVLSIMFNICAAEYAKQLVESQALQVIYSYETSTVINILQIRPICDLSSLVGRAVKLGEGKLFCLNVYSHSSPSPMCTLCRITYFYTVL